MIFVAGTITIEQGQVGAWRSAVEAMSGTVREEDGCLHYSLLVEDAVAGLINVLEMWESEDHLKAHLETSVIKEFFARFAPHIVEMNAMIYDATNQRPVPLSA